MHYLLRTKGSSLTMSAGCRYDSLVLSTGWHLDRFLPCRGFFNVRVCQWRLAQSCKWLLYIPSRKGVLTVLGRPLGLPKSIFLVRYVEIMSSLMGVAQSLPNQDIQVSANTWPDDPYSSDGFSIRLYNYPVVSLSSNTCLGRRYLNRNVVILCRTEESLRRQEQLRGTLRPLVMERRGSWSDGVSLAGELLSVHVRRALQGIYTWFSQCYPFNSFLW